MAEVDGGHEAGSGLNCASTMKLGGTVRRKQGKGEGKCLCQWKVARYEMRFLLENDATNIEGIYHL